LKEEDERRYFTARQQLLDQTATDEQIARELQEQSSQVTVNLLLLGYFCVLKPIMKECLSLCFSFKTTVI
jgi:hypothetical protein